MWNRRLKRQIPDGTRVGGCNRSYSGGWGCGGGVEIIIYVADFKEVKNYCFLKLATFINIFHDDCMKMTFYV